jgi:hypothetical protein
MTRDVGVARRPVTGMVRARRAPFELGESLRSGHWMSEEIHSTTASSCSAILRLRLTHVR